MTSGHLRSQASLVIMYCGMGYCKTALMQFSLLFPFFFFFFFYLALGLADSVSHAMPLSDLQGVSLQTADSKATHAIACDHLRDT
jgi:hypothetical protein